MTVRSDSVVGEISFEEFGRRLGGDGLGVRFGPFDFLLQTDVRPLYEPLYQLYGHYPLLEGDRVFSCHASLTSVPGVRFWRRRMIRFAVDGRPPHEDMPAEQALAILEWGLNLVIALRFHRFLMLHSAVLERNGGALLMPAAPGHGKTTLCAALAHRGWRLLSDEFGLMRPEVAGMVPVPRPMALKNDSIEVIRSFAPDAFIGPEIPNTRKGTVAHLRPTPESVWRADELATARWIVFPRWVKDASLELAEVPQAQGFMGLASNAFNYEMQGEPGFSAVRDLAMGARCFSLVYSDLEEAVDQLNRLADADGR